MSNLPPGTTPGDVDARMGPPTCADCGAELADGDPDVARCDDCRYR